MAMIIGITQSYSNLYLIKCFFLSYDLWLSGATFLTNVLFKTEQGRLLGKAFKISFKSFMI